MGILETSALTRRFGELTAVDELTLSVAAGQVFGLLGPNGAGKTTTIKMLTTLLPPTSGNATIAGYDVVHHASDVRRVVGYVPQLISADSSLTGYENLMVFAKLYELPGRECATRVRQALAFMGLTDAAHKLVRDYSGGTIRRLEVAQSMLHRRPLLLLDEPTVGLDPGPRRAVWEHIEILRREFGMTIFMTTHMMEEADSLCDRVVVMHRGRVSAIGTPAELKASIGREGATLDEVFIHYAGDSLESGGTYNETSRSRRTARRLG